MWPRAGCSALNTLAGVWDGGLVSVRMCFFLMWTEKVMLNKWEEVRELREAKTKNLNGGSWRLEIEHAYIKVDR